MLITQPGVQNPHCEPLRWAIRSCTGWSPCRVLPRPSTVVTAWPSSEQSGWRQLLISRCSTVPVTGSRRVTSTVQAPQPPSPHTSFVPVRPTAGERR